MEMRRAATPRGRAAALGAYLDAARAGRDGLWRLALMTALIAVGWVLAMVCFAATVTLLGFGPSSPEARDHYLLIATLFGGASLPFLLALFMPLLQGRRAATLLGLGGRLDWGHVWIGGAAAAAMVGIGGVIGWALGLNQMRWIEGYQPPWAMMAAVILLIPLQSAGEELVFRGYFLQELGRRLNAATPLGAVIWAAAPAAFFASLHLGTGTTALDEALYFSSTFVFGLFAAGLVWLSGGLSAAIGFHVANNLLSILLFEPPLGVPGLGPIAVDFVPERLGLSILTDLVMLAIVWAILSRALRPRALPGQQEEAAP